jgi:nitrate/nitrite-specific signal transduction histidine kinase
VIITARTISTPITKLAGAVEQVARGNFYERADIERDDEIGALANSFNSMADELQQLVTSLEGRVAERTEDLEKQATRLRVASEVARDAATARSLDQLLNRSAQLILDRFGFYHTGIFLLDHNREYAVLRASPTPAGQEMLARQHRLRVGETGIVGYVAATGEPRIALDTGADAVYFRNPLLPQTHSELALPLKVENRVIGVLDVQSDQPEAFKQDDIATLQIMADQLGTAIERTRLLQEFEQSLAEIERVYQRFTRESWQGFLEHQKAVGGYSFDGLRLEPLAEVSPEVRQVLKRGAAVSSSGEGLQRATLSVPVKLRGQTLGVINVKLQGNNIPPDTAALVDEAAARLAFALENSRLIAESQQRASRERAIADASAKIGASRDTEQIMRAAIEELQNLLGDPEVAIQLKTDQGHSA